VEVVLVEGAQREIVDEDGIVGHFKLSPARWKTKNARQFKLKHISGRCYNHKFCDFPQFSSKKIGVFLKYQCNDKLFPKFSFVLSQKRQLFRKIYQRKYLKNNNIDPRTQF
jgi:hypothetical protein